MLRKIAILLEAIKFSHSVFALPFALAGMLLAANGWPGARTFALIVAAAVFARSAAMGFNRWADADIDSRNPRTKTRAIPAGQLSRRAMLAFTVVCALLFIGTTALLNPLCLALALPTLAILLGYSFAKRFTSAVHFWLGLSLGIAPIGAWIAVRGSLAPLPLVLGAAVALWVAGFDILYACQDYEVDVREGLNSVPARLGIARAMTVSSLTHAAAFAAFSAAGWLAGLGVLYWVALLGVGGLLVWQHSIVKPNDLSRLNAAFFQANGLISIGYLGAVAASLWLR